MTGHDHDDAFEAYLKRRVPLHERLASLERLEPSEELDRLVIGRARQAIQGTPQVRVFRAPKWALPVGLAATLIISFTVLLNLGLNKARPLEAPPVQTAVVESAPVDATMPDREPPPNASTPAKDSVVASAAKDSVVASAAKDSVVASAAKDSVVASAAKDSVAAAAARASRAKVPRPGPRVVATRSLPKESFDIPVETQSTAIVDTSNQHVPVSPSVAVAEGGGGAPAQTDGAPLQAMTGTSPPALLPAAPDAGAGTRLDAATWFAQIEKLRAEGKTSEAEKEFRRFRDVYPHYVPPPHSPPADGPTK